MTPSWAPGLSSIVDKGFGRTRNGNTVNGMVVHITTSVAPASAIDYMQNVNSRNSHPNYGVKNDGTKHGIIHPSLRPSSTGNRPDPEAVVVEIDNLRGAPNWEVSDAAISAFIDISAHHYKESPRFGGGVARNIVGKYQDEFFIGWHSQYAAVTCPGAHLLSRMDAIVAGVATVAAGGHIVPGDTVTGPSPLDRSNADVRLIGTFLNSQGLADFKTGAAGDGIPRDPGDVYSKYWHLVQLWGVREGVYDTNIHSVDGIVGPRTRQVETLIWERLNNIIPPLPEPEPEIPVIPEPEIPVIPEPEPEPVIPVTEDQEVDAVALGRDLIEGKLDTAGWIHARVRTIVPLIVGPVLTWAATNIPGVTEFLTTQFPGWEEIIYGGVSAAFGYGWWTLAGALGRKWPIVERIMLGSSKRPVYVGTPSSGKHVAE